MTKSDLQFQIDQLRQDKIIYAVESIATTAAALLTIFILLVFGSTLGPTINVSGVTYPIIPLIISVTAIIYWVYISFGNFKRLQKIKELEQELKKL